MGARDLLHDLLTAGFTLALADGKLLVTPASMLTDDLRAALRASKPELLALLAGPARAPEQRPYRLTKAQGDVGHAEPWDEAAIGRFQARAAHIQRRGFAEQDAEDLSEHLHLRDVHADFRHLCLECRHMAGTVSTVWRCGNHRAAQVARDLPAVLVTLAQHCPGFNDQIGR